MISGVVECDGVMCGVLGKVRCGVVWCVTVGR